MGTLTANQARLPEHCEHKLPTSCRLSSIPNCCACADERAHAPTYRTYIDGIGFVLRGNRWDRYCWYCKEFWEKRVRVSGLESVHTRIPEHPEQSEFLRRWYEFHRGFRTVRSSDGSEERVAVLGEDFKDVSPGCLPRTLEEMRAGRQAEEIRQPMVQVERVQESTGPTLDETLDLLLADAMNEEQAQPPTQSATVETPLPQPIDEPRSQNVHAQAMNPALNPEYQLRRVHALRRELRRMRTGVQRVVSGLLELGENIGQEDSAEMVRSMDNIIEMSATVIPTHTSQQQQQQDSLQTNTGSNRALASLQDRIDQARTRLDTATQTRHRLASDLRDAETELQSSTQHLQQLQREQRTVENYTRVFGTREEMAAQGESYVSPIGSMFSRAYERFRAAEDVRREQRTLRQVLEDEERIDTDEAVSRRLEELETRERDVWSVPRLGQTQALPADVPPAEPSATRPTRTLRILRSNGHVDEAEGSPPPMDRNLMENPAFRHSYAMAHERGRPTMEQNGAPPATFPQGMLAGLAEYRQQGQAPFDSSTPVDEDDVPRRNAVDAWWHEDAEIIIRTLTTDESLREELNISAPDAAILLAYFIDGMLPENDRTTIGDLFRSPIVIWRAGLPSVWLNRRTDLLRRGTAPGLFFSGEEHGGSAARYNHYMRTEIIAQAFTMSVGIRRQAPSLTAPEQLQMLYRLQAGQRSLSDVATLEQMASDEIIFSRAHELYILNAVGDEAIPPAHDAAQREQRDVYETRDANSFARAFALAAGRQAFQTGPQALIDQAAAATNAQQALDTEQEAGTRAVIRRLHNYTLARHREGRRAGLSDSAPSSAGTSRETSPGLSSREPSPEPSRGLDAQDSGRPDPRADADMLVSMECKVCYTQLADVACLPCGHLVMCRWCSEQHSPCLPHDRTRPRLPAGCPVCRKRIKQKVRVFRA